MIELSYSMSKNASLTRPKGFLFATEEAAIKKPGRKDIALIFSEVEAKIAGTFTTNAVKAAPVKICMQKIKLGKGQAIIINSGNANACTGKQGIKDAQEIVSLVSKNLGIKTSLTYICSTGVIGTPLPMKRVIPSITALTKNIGTSSLSDVAKAIMTTDTFPKILHKRIKIGKKIGTLSGICKGAGMIAPNMATMLCFVLTDIAFDQKTMNAMIKNAVMKSFNNITIDGDMSTNDSVLMISNGLLGNKPVTRKSPYFLSCQTALDAITLELSRLIVKDGEGATKFTEVLIRGAKNERDAQKAGFAVANSKLVKTALYGNDANWGRIMAVLGYTGITFNPEKTDITFNNIKVVKGGLSNNKDKEANKALKAKEIKLIINLHAGSSTIRVFTCDLTEKYVRINAEYRT